MPYDAQGPNSQEFHQQEDKAIAAEARADQIASYLTGHEELIEAAQAMVRWGASKEIAREVICESCFDEVSPDVYDAVFEILTDALKIEAS